MAKFNTESEYLIHLLYAVINSERPEEMPENLDFNELFKLAAHHSVANMAYYGVEQLTRKPAAELATKWAEIRDKEIVKDITQLMELEVISEALSQAGIRFIPLKGSFLKTLYPQSDFRTMSDLDIYIDGENLEKAGEVLKENGYHSHCLEEGVHDVYYKEPVMNVEVHTGFFGTDGSCFNPIFDNIWEKCTPADGKRHDLAPEYFFAFLMAHGMKHYRIGGSGIRCFMDIHIYRKAIGEKLDMAKVRAFFEGIGEQELFDNFLALSEIWFEGRENDEKYHKMADYIIRGGVYGTFENFTLYGMESQGKWRFMWNRLFPSFAFMKEHFPILRKAPVLLPFCWVARMVRAVTKNRKQNAEKLKTFIKN